MAQLTQGITPQKIALTIAVGSAVALFPILGTTTLLCFLVGIALRLNQPIIQLINQALWPLHVPVIFLCVRLGERLFRVPHAHFSIRQMNRLLWDHPGQFFEKFGTTAVHATVAWALLAPVYIGVVYAVSLPITRSIYRIKREAAAKAAAELARAASADIGEHPVP